MLIDIPFEVELIPSLVIRRRVDVVERHTERTRYLEARLRVEVGVGAPDVQGRPVQAEERSRAGAVDPGRDGAGCDQVPVIIALLPAQQSRHHAIPNTPNRLSKTARDGISQRTGHGNASRGALGADGKHCCGKSQISTKNLGVRNPADGPGINQEIRLDSSTQGEIAERKLAAAAGGALEQIGAKRVFRGRRGLDDRETSRKTERGARSARCVPRCLSFHRPHVRFGQGRSPRPVTSN